MEEGLKSRCVGAAQSGREQDLMLSLLRVLVTPPSYIPTAISVFTMSRVLSTRITASRSLRTSEETTSAPVNGVHHKSISKLVGDLCS